MIVSMDTNLIDPRIYFNIDKQKMNKLSSKLT